MCGNGNGPRKALAVSAISENSTTIHMYIFFVPDRESVASLHRRGEHIPPVTACFTVVELYTSVARAWDVVSMSAANHGFTIAYWYIRNVLIARAANSGELCVREVIYAWGYSN